MYLKKCLKCGALIKVFNDCNCEECGIKCCNEEMLTLTPNDTDGSAEKHVPNYRVEGDKIIVSVPHVMEEDHYIEWISYIFDNTEQIVYFKPGSLANQEFTYVKGATIYAYCNKHSIWLKEVE